MNYKSFSQSLEQFFLTFGQNNFGNKIPLSIVVKNNQIVGFRELPKIALLKIVFYRGILESVLQANQKTGNPKTNRMKVVFLGPAAS